MLLTNVMSWWNVSVTPSVSEPTVTTGAVSSVSYTGATVAGNVTDDGGATVTERGICYGTSANPDTDGTHIASGSGTGSFTANLTGLTAGTTYYVRAYAVNSAGTAYGSQASFATAAAVTVPTVTTGSATNVAQTSATVAGNVTADGGATVTERGICYGTSANPTVSGTHVASGSGTGSFTANLTGLTAGTTYYVRAYAVNSAGTAYGSQASFATESGSGDSSVLESIFSSINSNYPGKIKYIATPGTPNSDIWLIVESTANSTSRTLVHVSTSGVISSTTLSSCPYLGSFVAYDNKVLIIYKTSSSNTATWYYKIAQYTNNSISISSLTPQTTLSAKYVSNMSDNLYTYNGSTFITIRGQMNSMETICTFNTSRTWTCSAPSKRTWAQFLTMTSAGKRRYFSGYAGPNTTDHRRNYKIYDSTNLSGNIETTLVGGDITYNTSYNNITKRFYTSDSFTVFQYTNMNANSQWTKYDFNSDYSNVSLGTKTLTMPSNKNSSVFGSYQVFLESPTIMWFYNSSGNFEKVSIDLT